MKLTLTHRSPEVAGVETFVFQPEGPLTWKAGQFIHYILPHSNPDDRGSERWFTISSAPFEGEVHITTRITSPKGSSFKQALLNLTAGDVIEGEDPDGEFVIDPSTNSGQDYVFIAGGIGITPFRSILLDLDHNNQPIKVSLLYGNRDQNIVFKKELDELAIKHPSLKIHYIIDPQKIDQDTIKQYIPDLNKPVFYVSGPEPMVEAMEKMLMDMGIKDENIKRDFFPGYKEI
ncbi:FAD-dependent oxidoreductase [Candidatus Daviesbacteria bacterium]|nr:FAD-dependent oxidoreductase [Candidatus Daviesbacteria bacterium]